MTAKTVLGRTIRCKMQMGALLCATILSCLSSCQTVPLQPTAGQLELARQIQAEPPGDYFIGRRYFKANYRFWGYVRRPAQPWNTAVLVMFNENKKLAPDRSQLGPGTESSYETHAGFDNDYEYKLLGHFSGDKVYELVSNRVYPEFVLTDYELRSTHPPAIFPSQITGRRIGAFVIEKPE